MRLSSCHSRQALDDAGLLPQRLFSIYHNTSNFNQDSGGEIIFGGTDTSLMAGSVQYVPLTQAGYWQFKLDDMAVKSVSCEACTPTASMRF